MAERVILAIDPGADKCGIAVITRSAVLDRGVVPTADLPAAVSSKMERHPIALLVVGDRTGSAAVRRTLTQHFPGRAVVLEGEEGTTLEGRRLYFADHPPRGWRRLIPRSMQVPPEPYDDYAAIAVGRRYLNRTVSGKVDGISSEEEESS